MKVKELIRLLERCNSEDLVVMSKDGEGNGYSPLYTIDGESRYRPNSTWSGEIGLRQLDEYYESRGYSEEDVMSEEDSQNCVVLWPTN
tara:strand:+ start:354 stop:617 length:264 start_codon:yes stop_codon:yes gene_type:complete